MIEIKHLVKEYKGKKIFKDVSLTIESKGVSFLMGKNGAGKSTFIKCLLNLESYHGTITLNTKTYDHQVKDVFAIYDDSALYRHLSGYENIRLITNVDFESIKRIALDYLGDDVLSKKAKFYSLGEKKKVFLIIIELIMPKIIIMDEVSSGLDYETLNYLKKRIASWSKQSCILLTGHQFDFYHLLIDNLLVIDNGLIKQKQYDANESLEAVYEKIKG